MSQILSFIIRRKKTSLFLAILLSLIITFAYGFISQQRLEVNRHVLTSSRIPPAFDDFKIVHLSDIHNEIFGEGQRELIDIILAENPDLIVISGDSVDRYNNDWQHSLTLLRELAKTTPVYFSSGNHEYWSSIHQDSAAILAETGAHYLKNETILLEKSGQSMTLSGIDDPWYFTEEESFSDTLKTLQPTDPNRFSMLISHRPERQDAYARCGFDLTFSGHAHGGQIRLPFTEGLVAPNQGFFPKLTAGLHEKNGKYLLISRGLGNPLHYPRLFNSPEVIVLTLKRPQ